MKKNIFNVIIILLLLTIIIELGYGINILRKTYDNTAIICSNTAKSMTTCWFSNNVKKQLLQ
jgi:hypothetical protein